MHNAFFKKTGQFAKLAKKSDSTPVVAAFSSDIQITPREEPSVHPTAGTSNYSFASIEEVLTAEEFACMVNTDLSTLLDSGMSSYIIKDSKYFWNYNQQGARLVKTANHGTLSTLASRDCIAVIRCKYLST